MSNVASADASYTLIATIGPDGAGKTSLARAFAEVLASRPGLASPARVMERDGFGVEVFEFRGRNGYYQHVDFADENAQHALLGTVRFSGSILAIAAPDGVLPGTRRSLERAIETGASSIVAALTRCDQVEDVELLDLVELEVRELLTKYRVVGHEGATVVRTSARAAYEKDAAAAQRFFELAQALERTVG